MLRALAASARSPECCQATQTWSRRLYYKLQCRLFHQSALLTCSEEHDPSKLKRFRQTGEKEDTRQSDIRFKFKPRDTSDEGIPQEDWQSKLDDKDTFGTLLESPEFLDSKPRHDKGRTVENRHSSKKQTEYQDFRAKPRYDNDKGHSNKNPTGFQQQYTKFEDERKRFPSKHWSSSEKSKSPKWSDTFGLMSKEGDETTADLYTDDKASLDLLHEEMSHKSHVPLGNYNRRHAANWYARRIMKLGNQGKVREAIEVFDQWMMKEDRVKPTVFEFTVLMNVLGRVGYTKKAFMLYQQMLRMGLKDRYEPHVFTCLFNACSNSPWPEDGLKRAVYLRTRMLVKDIKPNYIVYNAMIKAFGICGDINTAFLLADEAAHFHKPDSNLLASLLVACITDKESGFRHAILVWRRLKKMHVEPELKDYCLLLRAVNECGIGKPEVAKDILLEEVAPALALPINQSSDDTKYDSKYTQTSKKSNSQTMPKKKQKQLKMFNEIDNALSKYVDDEVTTTVSETKAVETGPDEPKFASILADDVGFEDKLKEIEANKEIPDNLEWWQMDVFLKQGGNDENAAVVMKESRTFSKASPAGNVLDPSAEFPQGVPLTMVKSREDRLALIGGYRRILQALKEKYIQPNIVFFMQLMLSVPAKFEDHLLDEMDMANVKPDITFYNLLLRKRALRQDKAGVMNLMKLVEEHDLVPNMITFGCLALTCHNEREARQLFHYMQEAGMEPNIQIMTALLAGSKFKFMYKKMLLNKMEQLDIKPGKRTLDVIERQIIWAKKFLADMEKKSDPGFNAHMFGSGLTSFIEFYDDWCRRAQLAKEDHPWEPFRTKKRTDSSVKVDSSEQ